ncbi:hydroxyisourate hydrolase [Agromyces sp. SYSU K20354]|uniref:hydroxyisourate hydrolase n=1 Tax=Agromyces cavernae TaxID=2898659 RepID=UPI001E2D4C31|nr:hydroxyisourate hydrolase [Agromyces cavernae]MCD2442914.1 hydroxyisourate hydrolase [Agromyces cavernae]
MSTSRITTHVLDATTGRPAAGLTVELLGPSGDEWGRVAASVTDDDGRISHFGPDELLPGEYRLRFDTGAWFAARGVDTFYPEVVITVRIEDDGRHVHAPLLLSPFAYSTYRGS